MVIIFKVGSWYTEEGLSSDKLKDKAAKTPNVEGFIDSSGEKHLRSPKTERSDGFCRRVGKEICYFSTQVSVLLRIGVVAARATNRRPCLII